MHLKFIPGITMRKKCWKNLSLKNNINMKSTFVITFFLFLISIALNAQYDTCTDALTGPWLGQKPPGMKPETGYFKMFLMPAFKIGICNAWLFMSAFIIQMFAIMLISKRVMERSHIPDEARKRKYERYISFIGNFIWLLALCYSVFLPLLINTVWFYIGLSVFVPGLILMSVATFNFIVAPADQLITAGAYRFSRHPMYLATLLICLGAGIAALSWFFILLSIIMTFCFYQEALIEERHCSNKYGKDYQKYMRGTPRVFGVPMMFRSHD